MISHHNSCVVNNSLALANKCENFASTQKPYVTNSQRDT